MDVVAAFTLWTLFSIWLLFQRLGAPRMLCVGAGLLMWLEFVSLLAWGYASEECYSAVCRPVATAARSAAAIDIPALTIALLAVAAAYAGRRLRAENARGKLSLNPPIPAASRHRGRSPTAPSHPRLIGRSRLRRTRS